MRLGLLVTLLVAAGVVAGLALVALAPGLAIVAIGVPLALVVAGAIVAVLSRSARASRDVAERRPELLGPGGPDDPRR